MNKGRTNCMFLYNVRTGSHCYLRAALDSRIALQEGKVKAKKVHLSEGYVLTIYICKRHLMQHRSSSTA